jgi:CRP-like cAMP-binding protein
MDRDERISALKAFIDCPLEVAQALDIAMAQRDFDHKQMLVHQGDHSEQIWLILDGEAQFQVIGYEGQITLLATLGPGELLGAFPEATKSSMDIKVHGHLTALQISTGTLRDLIIQHPRLGAGLSRILGNQYNALMDRLASHVTLTARGRVYRELLGLLVDSDQLIPPPVVAALALRAQTTRETASRAISDLKRRGIIQRDKNKLEIISRPLLEALVI